MKNVTVIDTYTRQAVLTRINELLVHINEAFRVYYTKTYANLTAPTVGIDGNGRRYVRVSMFKFSETRGKSYPESVYFFVDMTNGDFLKADGYKSPAKGKRGNIFDGDTVLSKMSPYGAGNYNGNCGAALSDILTGKA